MIALALAAALSWTTVNSVATGDQDNAAISVTRTGYTAVVWEDERTASEVFVRLYRDGVSVYEKKLSNGGKHIQPDVALHEDGSAVVVWAEDPDLNGFYNIAVRVLRPNGDLAGSATANADAAGQQTSPRVAANPENPGFAVVWEDKTNAVRISGFAEITKKTYEAQVHAGGGTHQRPDVAMGAAGNAIVVWDEDGDGNGFFNIGRKILTPSGGVKLAQGIANSTGAGQQRHPSVEANFNGDFAVAWETENQVAARSFSAVDTPGSADVLLPGRDPQVGIDDQRNVVVQWTSGEDVFAQGLNADGTPTGRLPRQATMQTAQGRQDEPALGVDAWGQISVVYTDDHDGNGFDQVYLGTGLANWP